MMVRLAQSGTALRGTLRRWGNSEAAALVEFAVSLPLLIVLVVGIFDFGAAFNMKQELNNALREGARFGAAQPTNDLCVGCASPPSVDAVRSLVDSYLQAAKINDCGLSGVSGFSPSPLAWTYSASGCGALPLTLTICRGGPGCAQQETLPGATNQVNLLTTQISISYPFQWHFNNVLQVLIPGARLGLTNIQTQATAVNMD
jgi:Flp pilus assembly protein TadG